jgi:hypothetical protein
MELRIFTASHSEYRDHIMSSPEDLKTVDDVELSLMSADFLRLIKLKPDEQAFNPDILKPWFVLIDLEDEHP